MQQRIRHLLAVKLTALGMLTIVISGQSTLPSQPQPPRNVRAAVGNFDHLDTPTTTADLSLRIAQRLRKRIRIRDRYSPPLSELRDAVTQRQQLLQTSARISLVQDSHTDEWDLRLSAHPDWIVMEYSLSKARAAVSRDRIEWYLTDVGVPGRILPKNTTLTALDETHDVLKVETGDTAAPGRDVDIARASDTLYRSLTHGAETVEIAVLDIAPTITNATSMDLGDLTLLTTGRSNYRGSTNARSHNVQKALNHHVNNSLVLPGETFSFNSTLDGRVSMGNGWAMAKVILNGNELVAQPGGGICQASTTTYRAILNAGFPVVARRSHSMYVSYYEKYGVGIDATIYPGQQDLAFVNDTQHPLLIQSYTTDDKEAYVHIYGTPDNRTVAIDGPYFRSTAPDGFTVKGRAMAGNEIAWVQRVTYSDGTEREEQVVSRYHTLPQSIAWKYREPGTQLLTLGQNTLHAAAQ